MHDWGSALGLDWARRHQQRVRGLVLMEFIWPMAMAYQDWLLETDIPKLFFWANPGSLISPARAAFLASRLKSCTPIPLGAGRHYVQEDHADLIGSEIAQWLPSLDRAGTR